MGKLLLEGQSQRMIAAVLEAAGFDTPATHAYFEKIVSPPCDSQR
ncbi:hypothetical protein ACFVTF_10430 [Kitasatospora sp. NPDC057940]